MVIQLRDIMTTEVLTTSAERPVVEVTTMMVKTRVGSAVVMQGSWLVGILTERDVLRAAASGSDLTRSPVSEWMTRDPVTASDASARRRRPAGSRATMELAATNRRGLRR